MKISEFQYTNPHLTEMVFMENPNFVMNKEKIEITIREGGQSSGSLELYKERETCTKGKKQS